MVVSQSKKMSLLETATGTLIGYIVALITQLLVFPWFGIQTTGTQNLTIALIFTVVSLIRSYFVRRLFNFWHVVLSTRK